MPLKYTNYRLTYMTAHALVTINTFINTILCYVSPLTSQIKCRKTISQLL